MKNFTDDAMLYLIVIASMVLLVVTILHADEIDRTLEKPVPYINKIIGRR